ncbi:NADH dehydrogenase subunit; NdhL (chromatophore) [Paulinella micropora]|uniref:NAD(P)H-quinone oxidoreductase subunit L n=1 Tax=Paulinella micropora TaxID=1928728 RepID=A0A1L5YAT2_9EUKA|nr:NADH dehydrogenase subunit [Paulinella micropora]APP87813.1 NADH dehydrogenase subunit; NdhL [Paulinella micropora]AQX44580.1 NADH dehydrogenase subunit [Paulinella micropora]AXY62971.1 NADH dehydrogenase subunit [Paulinella micropora]BBL86659.1 NADH dehydrogenase subunit; NdhL [Paulinella micropora]
MSFLNHLCLVSTETRLLLLEYSILVGIYLIFVPFILYWWMNARWYTMGKFERLGVYGLVFLFFPGLIILSPFINLRLKGQGEN